MQVDNLLVEKSFQFTQEKNQMLARTDEIGAFAEIAYYCDQIREKLKYQDELWDVEVEEGVTFSDWLYSGKGTGCVDDRRRMQEIFSKSAVMCDLGMEDQQAIILVSCGPYENTVCDKISYIEVRREYLSSIKDVEEYEAFMHSCFIDSIFAENIVREMKNIKNFSQNSKEITKCLSVLNDEAISLYQQYRNHLSEAMNILSVKLCACGPDPKHEQSLNFPFQYEELLYGKKLCCYKGNYLFAAFEIDSSRFRFAYLFLVV